MKLRTRRILFYSLIFVFCLLGTILIFYSNGWRWDPETKTIKKLGGLYIETASADVSVRIGKNSYSPNRGILNSSTLVSNLFPKTYRITVSETGYQTWTKELAVRPSLVTKTYPIILIPEVPKLEIAESGALNFWLGPKYLAWETSSGKLFINNIFTPGQKISSWSSSGSSALALDSQGDYFFIDADNGNTYVNLNSAAQKVFPDGITKASFYPNEDKKLIVSAAGRYYLFDLDAFTIQPISVKALPKADSGEALISPDNKKSAALNAGEVGINLLADDEVLQRKAKESFQLDIPAPASLADLNWYQNSAYLFVKSAGNLYFAEIDDRSAENIQLIAKNIRKYQYDSGNNLLYILKNNNLYKFVI